MTRTVKTGGVPVVARKMACELGVPIDEPRLKGPLKRLGRAAIWILIVLACWLLGAAASLVNIPAPHLLVSIVVGAVLALAGWVRTPLPRRVNIAAQAGVGALMGGYLDLDSVPAIAGVFPAICCAIITTIALSMVTGLLLPRLVPIGARDSVLGMVPGGSAAIVAVAEELKADPRIVAFMQYLRIAIVAASAPLVVMILRQWGPDESTPRAAAALHRVPISDPQLVDSDNPLLGIAVLVALCVSGYLIGRLLRLPAAATVGPMLLTAGVLLLVRHQFTPGELASQYLFVIIGLEIGLRFTRALLRQILRLVPGIVLATIAVTSASSLVAYALSMAEHIPFLDAYLATTPGGINAVLAVAASGHAQLTIISTTQTLRLFVIVLLMPIFLRWLANRHKPATLPSRAAADET
jgi:hypothetical protein